MTVPRRDALEALAASELAMPTEPNTATEAALTLALVWYSSFLLARTEAAQPVASAPILTLDEDRLAVSDSPADLRRLRRHLANRAPSLWYSARRSRSPSSPSVTVSIRFASLKASV